MELSEREAEAAASFALDIQRALATIAHLSAKAATHVHDPAVLTILSDIRAIAETVLYRDAAPPCQGAMSQD